MSRKKIDMNIDTTNQPLNINRILKGLIVMTIDPNNNQSLWSQDHLFNRLVATCITVIRTKNSMIKSFSITRAFKVELLNIPKTLPLQGNLSIDKDTARITPRLQSTILSKRAPSKEQSLFTEAKRELFMILTK